MEQSKCYIHDSKESKKVLSLDYNYVFNKKTGVFIRWGKDNKDDPIMAPMPEIADVEISTVCKRFCPSCYKSNTSSGKNMSFVLFKNIINKIKYLLTQVAFGTGSTGTENPEIWKMMRYCRKLGIVPNITIAETTWWKVWKFSRLCGAVAVSRYKDKEVCYDAIYKLSRFIKQTNMHILVAEQTYDDIIETLNDIKSDYRLEKLNAIVFLAVKQVGRAKNTYTPLSQSKFNSLIEMCLRLKIKFGADSCSANKVLEALPEDIRKKQKNNIENCCASLFSSYFNIEGKYYPCSFMENYFEGIPVNKDTDFYNDVWQNPQTKEFRKKLLETIKNNKHNCRECPQFTI